MVEQHYEHRLQRRNKHTKKSKKNKKKQQSTLKKWEYTQKKKVQQILSSLRSVLVIKKKFHISNLCNKII